MEAMAVRGRLADPAVFVKDWFLPHEPRPE